MSSKSVLGMLEMLLLVKSFYSSLERAFLHHLTGPPSLTWLYLYLEKRLTLLHAWINGIVLALFRKISGQEHIPSVFVLTVYFLWNSGSHQGLIKGKVLTDDQIGLHQVPSCLAPMSSFTSTVSLSFPHGAFLTPVFPGALKCVVRLC